jgi:hypothetical protein
MKGIFTMTINVISAFPGTGKSHFAAIRNKNNIPTHDSDSSKFPKGNGEFPDNYIEHIKTIITNNEQILVSSHDDVRKALKRSGIRFILVFPEITCKSEYLERYRRRGSPDAFVQMMEDNWEKFIESCVFDQNCTQRIILNPGTYISDIFIPRTSPTSIIPLDDN